MFVRFGLVDIDPQPGSSGRNGVPILNRNLADDEDAKEYAIAAQTHGNRATEEIQRTSLLAAEIDQALKAKSTRT